MSKSKHSNPKIKSDKKEKVKDKPKKAKVEEVVVETDYAPDMHDIISDDELGFSDNDEPQNEPEQPTQSETQEYEENDYEPELEQEQEEPEELIPKDEVKQIQPKDEQQLIERAYKSIQKIEREPKEKEPKDEEPKQVALSKVKEIEKRKLVQLLTKYGNPAIAPRNAEYLNLLFPNKLNIQYLSKLSLPELQDLQNQIEDSLANKHSTKVLGDAVEKGLVAIEHITQSDEIRPYLNLKGYSRMVLNNPIFMDTLEEMQIKYSDIVLLSAEKRITYALVSSAILTASFNAAAEDKLNQSLALAQQLEASLTQKLAAFSEQAPAQSQPDQTQTPPEEDEPVFIQQHPGRKSNIIIPDDHKEPDPKNEQEDEIVFIRHPPTYRHLNPT